MKVATCKVSKKTKRTKSTLETSNVYNFPDISPKPKTRKGGDRHPPTQLIMAKTRVKSKQLEKRNKDVSEWKALKKIDYQKLETVLEEEQLSSEETTLKPNCEEGGKSNSERNAEEGFTNAGLAMSAKPGLYNVSLRNKDFEEGSGKIWQLQKQHWTQQQLFIISKLQEKNDKSVIQESHGEPVEPVFSELDDKFALNKRKAILNGMMEILPIFFNLNFVCSKDAIGAEEYGDLEALEKKVSVSRKSLFEGRSAIDTKPTEVKFLFSSHSVKKDGFCDQSVEEKLPEPRDLTERKFRYKILTDKNINYKESSPFINSLLILSVFTEGKKKFIENDAFLKKYKSGVNEELESSFLKTPGIGFSAQVSVEFYEFA